MVEYYMGINDFIIIVLLVLLIISILNYIWLKNDVNNWKDRKYLSNINQNKYNNVNIKTITYIYPKKWAIDKCYDVDCDTNINVVDKKLKLLHDDLYNLGDNKKILIVENNYNLSNMKLSTDELNAVSFINSL
jgi:hypothetical protein